MDGKDGKDIIKNDTSGTDETDQTVATAPTFEDIVASMDEDSQKYLAKQMAETPDKEKFDYQKFAQLFWRQDVQSNDLDGTEPIDSQISYLKSYYSSIFSDILTIEDFARKLEEIRASGDY